MLTQHEQNFIEWWKQSRVHKKKVLGYITAGLPLGVVMATAIMATYFSKWYKRAVPLVNMHPSGILVVLGGLLLVVVFIVIFSACHKWEMNEQRYQELLAKKDLP